MDRRFQVKGTFGDETQMVLAEQGWKFSRRAQRPTHEAQPDICEPLRYTPIYTDPDWNARIL